MIEFALRIADGTAFFVGLVVTLVAQILLWRIHHSGAFRTGSRLTLTALAALAMLSVVASATPLALWLYLCWGAPAIAGLLILNRKELPARLSTVSLIFLSLATAGLFVAEVPHWTKPRVVVRTGATIYVLGDSLSAGIGAEHRPWPSVLDDKVAWDVVNLAQSGAKVQGAIAQAAGIAAPRSLVIVEIGGNDLLAGADVRAFRAQLEQLIRSLRAAQHEVLLVELPLLPLSNAYGRTQREIAARHGAILLPKRFLAEAMRTGLLADLHLSQAGHEVMAEIVAGVLEQE